MHRSCRLSDLHIPNDAAYSVTYGAEDTNRCRHLTHCYCNWSYLAKAILWSTVYQRLYKTHSSIIHYIFIAVGLLVNSVSHTAMTRFVNKSKQCNPVTFRTPTMTAAPGATPWGRSLQCTTNCSVYKLNEHFKRCDNGIAYRPLQFSNWRCYCSHHI